MSSPPLKTLLPNPPNTVDELKILIHHFRVQRPLLFSVNPADNIKKIAKEIERFEQRTYYRRELSEREQTDRIHDLEELLRDIYRGGRPRSRPSSHSPPRDRPPQPPKKLGPTIISIINEYYAQPQPRDVVESGNPDTWGGIIAFILQRWGHVNPPPSHETLQRNIRYDCALRRVRNPRQQVSFSLFDDFPHRSVHDRHYTNNIFRVINRNLPAQYRRDIPYPEADDEIAAIAVAEAAEVTEAALRAAALIPRANLDTLLQAPPNVTPTGGYGVTTNTGWDECLTCMGPITPEEAEEIGIAFCENCPGRTHLHPECYNAHLRAPVSTGLRCPYCNLVTKWWKYNFNPGEIAFRAPQRQAAAAAEAANAAKAAEDTAQEKARQEAEKEQNIRDFESTYMNGDDTCQLKVKNKDGLLCVLTLSVRTPISLLIQYLNLKFNLRISRISLSYPTIALEEGNHLSDYLKAGQKVAVNIDEQAAGSCRRIILRQNSKINNKRNSNRRNNKRNSNRRNNKRNTQNNKRNTRNNKRNTQNNKRNSDRRNIK